MINDLANISEVVSALAVLISLIYLGFQIKQHTKAVQSAAAQAVHDNYSTWYNMLASNSELNRIAIEGLKNYAALKEVERGQFVSTFMSFLSYSQNAFYKWREGSLPDNLWHGWELLIMNLVKSHGGKQFWDERGYIFGKDFQSYVEHDIMSRKPDPRAKPFGAFELG